LTTFLLPGYGGILVISGDRPLLQPPATPRFQEDSALKKHWPLIWLCLLLLFTSFAFSGDVQSLGHIFERRPMRLLSCSTNFIFPNSDQHFFHSAPVTLNPQKMELVNGKYVGKPVPVQESAGILRRDGAFWSRLFLARIDNRLRKKIDAERCQDFLQWTFHRKMAFSLLSQQDYEQADSEFSTALTFAEKLGPSVSCLNDSLTDLGIFHELRAMQMQQVSAWLLRVALPIFSFFAALLPFALFLHFMKSRDRDAGAAASDRAAMARLWLKTSLLASWFAVVVCGWAALRNYGMGLINSPGDPALSACGLALAALVVSLCMMVRYMPPYKSLSLKRTLVGFGFGGILIVLKSLTIYWALCLSLAGHPALKEALFSEHLIVEQTRQAEYYVGRALAMGRVAGQRENNKIDRSQFSLIGIAGRSINRVENEWISQAIEALDFRSRQNLGSAEFPYLYDVRFDEPGIGKYAHRPGVLQERYAQASTTADPQNISVALVFKTGLVYFLIFCPELLAYILLGLRQRPLALKAFNSAVTIKEYFFGVDHWLVVGMHEMFGLCLLGLKSFADLRLVGEDYLRQAILRYERSRGRHDQLTISAKLSLALIYSERGDEKQAEKILTEALRDVGKDFDTLAFCALLSEIGRLYCKRNNYSRAKQMYKQVIDLLEQKISKTPSSRGFFGYLRNVYANIPHWQLELKLIAAYLDLAEVFHQAKYNGEAQRLTEDAGKLVSSFEADFCIISERASLYVRARLAQASILSSHGRVDECFKLLASAHKYLSKWGYGRSQIGFEFSVARAEIELTASRGQTSYIEMARKNYLNARKIFGDCGSHLSTSSLIQRWSTIGDKLGLRCDMVMTPSFATAAKARSSIPATVVTKPVVAPAGDATLATIARSALEGAAETSPADAVVSKLIQEAQAFPEEGIVLRWKREHHEEKIFG
jgi:tetratricopeptide (TPR) repeat protein